MSDVPQLPAPSATLRSAIITVSYGSGEALENFLSSLREHESDEQVIVVVDNKPDHENVRELSERFGARYVPLPENPGYGAGMNAGVRALEAPGSAAELEREHQQEAFDAYFFCNPDVSFIAPAIEALAASLMGEPTAGSIGPQLLNDDGTVYPSARNIPSIGTGAGHALFGKIWPSNPWSRAYKDAENYGSRRSAGSLSGAAVMVKRSVYEQLGGWDEAYFMHFEDIDLGWRIGCAGLENIYEPAVSVVHSGAHSTKKHAVAVEQAMTDSAIRFMGKRYAGFWSTPLRWAITAALKLRGMLTVRAARRAS